MLKMLVFTLRLAQVHTSGRPRSRGFIDFLNTRFAETAASPDGAEESTGRIILS